MTLSFSSLVPRKTRMAALLATPLFLGACSGSVDTGIFNIFEESVPLPCPRVEVLPGADTIAIYREGAGRDLVDVRFEGALEAVSGICQYVDDDSAVVVELVIQIGAIKGPAADSQIEEFPFFVAIAERSGDIVAKKVFNSPIEIPGARRRGAVQEEIEQRIPLPGGKSGADYVIIYGFQLTQEQLDRRK